MDATDEYVRTNKILEQAIEEARAGLEVAAARVYRLLDNAFEDPVRAKNAFASLIQQNGAEETIRILGSESMFGRFHHFGFTRAAWFAKGSGQLAQQALQELPHAIRERQEIENKIKDLTKARRVNMERADTARLEVRQRHGAQHSRDKLRTRE